MAGGLAEVLGEVLVAADGEEVAVAALAARGVSLVGLYFGCSLSGPCAQLGASLAAFYGRFRGEAAAAGAQRLEIVFVSAEQEQQQWQEAVRAMPWLALPFADKHRKVRPRRGCGEGFVCVCVCRGGGRPHREGPAGLCPAGDEARSCGAEGSEPSRKFLCAPRALGTAGAEGWGHAEGWWGCGAGFRQAPGGC